MSGTPADLSEADGAVSVRKRPLPVQVVFAAEAGRLQTLEGPVGYLAGDAMLTGPLGEQWPVRRAQFEATYEPLPDTRLGGAGAYRKRPQVILARRLEAPATVSVGRGDPITGRPGDWLVQYGPGEFGIVAEAVFAKTYELV